VAELNAPGEEQEQPAVDVEVKPVQAASMNAAKDIDVGFTDENSGSNSFGKTKLFFIERYTLCQAMCKSALLVLGKMLLMYSSCGL
jgi:hypothetical protein